MLATRAKWVKIKRGEYFLYTVCKKKKCIFLDNFFFLLQSGRTPSCTEWEMSPYVPTRNKYWQELCARKNSYHMSGLLTLSLPPPSSDSKDRVFYVIGILYCFSAGFRFENSFFSLMDDRGYRPAMLNCKKNSFLRPVEILTPCAYLYIYTSTCIS